MTPPTTSPQPAPATDQDARAGTLDPLSGARSTPLDAPLYAPGARGWPCPGTQITTVTYETDLAPFAAILPRPLRAAHERPRVTVTALEFRGSAFGDYDEMKLDLAAELDGEPVRCCAYIVVGPAGDGPAPDAALAIGRELIGVPKKLGRIAIRRSAGQVVAHVERPAGTTLMTIGVTRRELVPPEQAGIADGAPAANLRLVPSVEGGRPSVAQLVRFATTIRADADGVWTGPGWVAPGAPSAEDPWALLPARRVVHAATFRADVEIPATGTVVHDYLAAAR